MATRKAPKKTRVHDACDAVAPSETATPEGPRVVEMALPPIWHQGPSFPALKAQGGAYLARLQKRITALQDERARHAATLALISIRARLSLLFRAADGDVEAAETIVKEEQRTRYAKTGELRVLYRAVLAAAALEPDDPSVTLEDRVDAALRVFVFQTLVEVPSARGPSKLTPAMLAPLIARASTVHHGEWRELVSKAGLGAHKGEDSYVAALCIRMGWGDKTLATIRKAKSDAQRDLKPVSV